MQLTELDEWCTKGFSNQLESSRQDTTANVRPPEAIADVAPVSKIADQDIAVQPSPPKGGPTVPDTSQQGQTKTKGPISTLESLNITRTQFSVKAWNSFVKDNRPKLLHYGEPHKVVAISPETWGKAEDWHVIGDVHGDFFALFNCLLHIQKASSNFKIIFLGDIVDRGPHPLECLWLILYLVDQYPHRILWLAGNHDVGIVERQDKSFASTVQPAEFVDELNKVDSWTPFRREFGREYIELVQDLPRAALSPDGTLFTHGGFPLVDLHKELSGKSTTDEKLAWLNSDKSLQDFTWTRITRYQKKIPNRLSTGSSYGFADFAAFCEATKDFFTAKRLVTGHEHPAGGVDEHPAWKDHRALTLKGFGFDGNNYESPEAFNTGYQDHLVIGRCRTDDIPEVIRLPVDREDLALFFDQEMAQRFAEVSQG